MPLIYLDSSGKLLLNSNGKVYLKSTIYTAVNGRLEIPCSNGKDLLLVVDNANQGWQFSSNFDLLTVTKSTDSVYTHWVHNILYGWPLEDTEILIYDHNNYENGYWANDYGEDFEEAGDYIAMNYEPVLRLKYQGGSSWEAF